MLHPQELETVFGNVSKLYSRAVADAFEQLVPQVLAKLPHAQTMVLIESQYMLTWLCSMSEVYCCICQVATPMQARCRHQDAAVTSKPFSRTGHMPVPSAQPDSITS